MAPSRQPQKYFLPQTRPWDYVNLPLLQLWECLPKTLFRPGNGGIAGGPYEGISFFICLFGCIFIGVHTVAPTRFILSTFCEGIALNIVEPSPNLSLMNFIELDSKRKSRLRDCRLIWLFEPWKISFMRGRRISTTAPKLWCSFRSRTKGLLKRAGGGKSIT